MNTADAMKSTPIAVSFARRCHGKSAYSKAVVDAHVAAGWTVREIYRGVTLLSPPGAK